MAPQDMGLIGISGLTGAKMSLVKLIGRMQW